MRGTLPLLLAALLSAGCSEGPLEPPDATSAALAVVVGAEVELHNTTAQDRWFWVMEREFSHLADWWPDPEWEHTWYRIPAGGRLRIPLTAVPGWHPGARLLYVIAWTRSVRVEGPDGFQWLAEDALTWEVALGS